MVSHSYLPIMRWKPSEVEALSKLDPGIRRFVFPVMELCPTAFIRYKKTIGNNYEEKILPVDTLSNRLVKLKSAIGEQHIGIDLIHIRDGKSPYDSNTIWNQIIGQNSPDLNIVPVTGFNRKGVAYQRLVGSVAKQCGNGVCIRVTLHDIYREAFEQDITKLLSFLQHEPSEIDLIVDLKLVDNETPDYEQFSQKIPEITKWRSLSIIGGSFPLDLSHLEPNDTYPIPRLEWIKWLKEVEDVGHRLVRSPVFGDYTVQHPIYQEPVRAPRVSASIRYTSSDRWVVLRGEWVGKENGSGYAQYPAWAQLLVDSPDLYSGPNFSFGDQYIMEKSKNAEKPGGRPQWLTAEINHHIVYTVCQIHPEVRTVVEKKAATVPETVKSTTPLAARLQRRSRMKAKN